MKTKGLIMMSIGAALGAAFTYLMASGEISFDRLIKLQEPTKYYLVADITNTTAPRWYGTNAVALQPDAAVNRALQHIRSTQPQRSGNWELNSLTYVRVNDVWNCEVRVVDKVAGDSQLVRLLLDGTVWKPRNK